MMHNKCKVALVEAEITGKAGVRPWIEALGTILSCAKKESSRDPWEIELNKRCSSFYVSIYDKTEEAEVDRSKEYTKST